jgi:hypothetical protein
MIEEEGNQLPDLGTYASENYGADGAFQFTNLVISNLTRIGKSEITFTGEQFINETQYLGSFDVNYNEFAILINKIKDIVPDLFIELVDVLDSEYQGATPMNLHNIEITVGVVCGIGKIEESALQETFVPFHVESIELEKVGTVLWKKD